jgi:peptidoglycan/LPS O-acetylase OafA/YrhL
MANTTFSLRKESGRLRAMGALSLAIGIVGACLFYWSASGPADQDPADGLPAYSRAETRALKIQMGATGVILTEWQQTLARPGAEAVMIAAGAALFAAYFFRAAWVLDDDERDRARAQAPRST